MSPSLLKTLHLLGVVLFLGNIIVTAFWKIMADRTRDLAVIRFAVRTTNWADVVFTFGGILVLGAAGHAMVALEDGLTPSGWLRWAYGLFAVTGLLWVGILIPVQRAQARLLHPLPREAEIPARYWRLAAIWAVAGSVATLLPLAILYLMTVKPI
ncbi:putative integral membrane protein [Herbaspirillum sp. CF444]|uniref:DUF2269 family protein n=1 Tax=Herbaspirillum sp. CF444 TaxID=1144319 RepID=UPI00027278AC|nr:DUF2269 family protein [Herbaspirillum sp. CF444]EJL93479.1 putative integral membrane protein [Herbaspirillum sp. CF444]